MWARVLVFFLAFVPVCRAEYYEADEDIDSTESYERYNEEIKVPRKITTVVEGFPRARRWDMEDLRMMNQEEPIVDVKGVPNNVFQVDKADVSRGPRNPRQHTDSYIYVESGRNRPEFTTVQGREFQQWMPSVQIPKKSPSKVKRKNAVSLSASVSRQPWNFQSYESETLANEKKDIVEVKKLQPVREGEVSKRSSIETWATTEATEATVDPNNYPQESTTYNPSEMQAEVKKLVKHWSSATNVDVEPQVTTTDRPSGRQGEVKKMAHLVSPISKSHEVSSSYYSAVMRPEVKKLVQLWSPSSKFLHLSRAGNVRHWSVVVAQSPVSKKADKQAAVKKLEPVLEHRIPGSFQHFNASADNEHHARHPRPFVPLQKFQSPHDVLQRSSSVSIQIVGRTMDAKYWDLMTTTQEDQVDSQDTTTDRPKEMQVSKLVHNWSPNNMNNVDLQETTTKSVKKVQAQVSTLAISLSPSNISYALNASGHSEAFNKNMSSDKPLNARGGVSAVRQGDETSAVEPPPTTAVETTTKTTTTTTTTTQPIDIEKIMAIISNLTYDYEWNLTEEFNQSLIEHGVPTCPWKGGGKWGPFGAWTATTAVTYSYDFENASVVTKCFVCGLRDREIPRNAFCADAFAADFLPLMPVDARARSRIAEFRKYCRYLDVQNYVENYLEPKAIYGRFTGGCAVRWTDLTGVYTQRTCRSRYRPLLGKHFASKRMAKLELALVNVDNGCIISPMATLLPVSRGISLYARFHACVCTSNWCNRAFLIRISTTTIVAFVLVHWLFHTWPS